MEKSRRPADFLTIDPSSTFMTATSSRNFEELPENFLESANSPLGQGNGNDGSASSPQLASLTPMAMSSSDQGTSYQYSSLKEEGPAGLLSPLHLDRRSSSTHFSQRNSGIYIKEEEGLDASPPQHLLMASMHGQQDLDRNDATPPAVSNVELASTMITTILGDQASPVASSSSMSQSQQSSSMAAAAAAAAAANAAALSQSVRRPSIAGALNGLQQDLKGGEDELGMINGAGRLNGEDLGYRYQAASGPPPKRVYSINDANDPLNAEIDDDIYIDTKDLCKRIAYELKQHSIPQAIFAERILCRSQGTLSDLLRNPKPWNKLKSGRETFRRMFNWVQQPLAMRLGILDMYNKDVSALEKASAVPAGMPSSNGGAAAAAANATAAAAAAVAVGNSGLSPPTPAQNVRHHRRFDRASMGEDGQPANKRPRLVFTDIQKRTLQAIFKETQRPSREMQQTIAEHLRLDLSTVANFFMNARRRSRLTAEDEPAPYQQVRAELEALFDAANAACVPCFASDDGGDVSPSSIPVPPAPAHPTYSFSLPPRTRFMPAADGRCRAGANTCTSSSAASSSPSPSPSSSPSPPSSQEQHHSLVSPPGSKHSSTLKSQLDSLVSITRDGSPPPPQLRAQQKPTRVADSLRTAHHSLQPQPLPRKVFVARANGTVQVAPRRMAAGGGAPITTAPPERPTLLSLMPKVLIATNPALAGISEAAVAQAIETLSRQQEETDPFLRAMDPTTYANRSVPSTSPVPTYSDAEANN